MRECIICGSDGSRRGAGHVHRFADVELVGPFETPDGRPVDDLDHLIREDARDAFLHPED